MAWVVVSFILGAATMGGAVMYASMRAESNYNR
jgi:hypothetical protein